MLDWCPMSRGGHRVQKTDNDCLFRKKTEQQGVANNLLRRRSEQYVPACNSSTRTSCSLIGKRQSEPTAADSQLCGLDGEKRNNLIPN